MSRVDSRCAFSAAAPPSLAACSPHNLRLLLATHLFTKVTEKMAGNAERTYLMIKPDGVQRGLAGKIIQRFEERGYKLVSATPPQSDFRPRARGPARAAAAGAGASDCCQQPRRR